MANTTSSAVQSQKESFQQGERDKDQQLRKLHQDLLTLNKEKLSQQKKSDEQSRNLEQEIDALNREKLDIQREKETVENQFADAQLQLSDLEKKRKAQEKELQEAKAKIQRLTITKDSYSTQKTMAENKNKEKDEIIDKLKTEIARNKEHYESETKKNDKKYQSELKKKQEEFELKFRTNKEEFETQKRDLESNISNIATEKQTLEIQIRKLQNNAETLQEEISEKDSKIEELEEKVIELEETNLGKKRRKRAIVTAKSGGDFKEADKVFLEKLEVSLKEKGVKHSILPLDEATEGAAYSHVVFMGHHVNSLRSDYDKHLGDRIEADKKCVILFHHTPKHKSKITPSRGTLPKDVTDHIQPDIIADCVYWSKDGFYDCPTNDTALIEVTEFLQEIS